MEMRTLASIENPLFSQGLWLTPAAFVAGLDDTASGVVPAVARGVSPVGATPLPPTHHADCSSTLS
jgi:hypothetical protein